MSRQQIIDRERRWALPAALAAIFSAILAFASLPIQSGAFDGTGPAEQLRSINDNSGAIIAASLLTALALLLMIGPLWYLFEAARTRSTQVRAAFVGFVFLGPILFAAQYVGSGLATKSLAEDFVSQQGQLTSAAPTLDEFKKSVQNDPKSFDKITFYPDENGLDATLNDDEQTVYSLEYPGSQEKQLQGDVDKAGIDNEESTDGKPGDDLADKLSDDSSGRTIVADLLLPALLGLITAVVYTCLHAMRVGLLTRFMGTLGMALGVSIVLVALFPLMLYMVALGFLFLGRLPGGRPAAWEAGEAAPWPGQGRPAPAQSDDHAEPIEGEATEVTNGDPRDQSARRERAKRKKRKRRG